MVLRVDRGQEGESLCFEGGGWLVVVKSALQKGQTGGKLASNWCQEIFCRKEKQDGADCGQEGESLSLEGGGWLLVVKSALQIDYKRRSGRFC